jgi:hypothetical protein
MANIIHPNESQQIIDLIKVYTEAQQRLIKVIGQKHSRKSNVMYERRILAQTNDTLKQLITDSRLWTNSNVPRQYKKAVNKAVSDYKAMGVKIEGFEAFSDIHNKEIDTLIRNTNNDFVTSTNFVGRSIRDNVRQISLDSITQSRITGRSVRQTREDLIQSFIDNNVTSMRTKNGRRINLDSYASMVARSTMTEVANQGVMKHLEANGKDLVIMSSHATTCPVCAPLQGRVYSISGNSKEYPPLDTAFTGVHANIHPNCRHVLRPYEPTKDTNRTRTKEFSNRPFDIDPRSNSQRINYDREQRNNRKRNADKKQWERYKIVMPSDTPKTLNGFRKSKKANSKKYQALKSQYASLRHTKID